MLLPWVLDNFAHPIALSVGTLLGCSCSSSQERICHWVWFPELETGLSNCCNLPGAAEFITITSLPCLQPKLVLNMLPDSTNAPFAAPFAVQKEERQGGREERQGGRERKRRKKNMKNI
jgi:hypothetical protein